MGENDSLATSEHLSDVGVGAAFQAARISGRLSGSTVPAYALSTREDQGSIPRATRTRIGATRPTVLVRSRIGDGRHGSARENTGDFDFFRVRVLEGQTLQATTKGSTLDTVLTVYDAKGRIVAANDDALDDTDVFSTVEKRVTRTATYYVMVSGYSDSGSVPQSPFRPGSGSGAGVEGRYTLRISAQHVDQDFYGVHLGSGDVLAGRLTGAATTVGVSRTDGRRMVTSTSDFSSFYPVTTQLTGGAASFAYVAAEPGWYAVSVQQGTGGYQLLVETSRPGPARRPAGAVQTVYLDFDGARLNTFTFGGPGVVTLSPLSRFLPAGG